MFNLPTTHNTEKKLGIKLHHIMLLEVKKEEKIVRKQINSFHLFRFLTTVYTNILLDTELQAQNYVYRIRCL